MLFLDEPTTGLDLAQPHRALGAIEALVAEGTTVLLTTQYLDEADRLADRIAVIDHGRVIAEGTLRRAQGRRSAASGSRSRLEDRAGAEAAIAALAPIADGAAVRASDGVAARAVRERSGAIAEAVRRLDEAGIGDRRHRDAPADARRRLPRR